VCICFSRLGELAEAPSEELDIEREKDNFLISIIYFFCLL